MNTQEIKSIQIPQGQCMACGGNGGELVANSFDIYGRHHALKFVTCACCDGGGTNCLRCWPQLKKEL